MRGHGQSGERAEPPAQLREAEEEEARSHVGSPVREPHEHAVGQLLRVVDDDEFGGRGSGGRAIRPPAAQSTEAGRCGRRGLPVLTARRHRGAVHQIAHEGTSIAQALS